MDNGITRVQRFVGLDVHAETIAVAVAEAKGGEVRSFGANTLVRKPHRTHSCDSVVPGDQTVIPSAG